MKLRSIHFHQVGPLGRDEPYILNFQDLWQKDSHDLVLLSGVNGCGKSTALRTVAHLWSLMEQWLMNPGKSAPQNHPSLRRLRSCKSVLMILEDLPSIGDVGVFYGSSEELGKMYEIFPDLVWVGEAHGTKFGNVWIENPFEKSKSQAEYLWLLYKKSILMGDREIPGMIHLDSEERHWVTPPAKLAKVTPDDSKMNWLATYHPQDAWQGQLENSLINLKTLDEERYRLVVGDLNSFLAPKKIDPQPDSRDMRLYVDPRGENPFEMHTLDDLSAGERQILIQLFLVSRWLSPRGIVMIDEPDLHLHPSLLDAFMARLESIVVEREGQLIVTSHNPELWRRYENKGLRIQMGSAKE